MLAAWFSFSARVKTPPKLLSTVLIGIATLAIASGAYETIRRLQMTTVEYRTANDAKQLGLRLSKLGHSLETQKVDTRSVVLATDPFVAEYLPTIAPQSVLWALHMFYLPRSASAEDKHRFLNYLYYTGRDPLTLYEQKETLDAKEKYILKFLVTLMEYDYAQSGRKLPIKEADRLALLNDYRRVIASFDRERATHPMLHYLVISKVEDGTFANLDRWYERDSGEQFGQFVLYRLKLRP